MNFIHYLVTLLRAGAGAGAGDDSRKLLPPDRAIAFVGRHPPIALRAESAIQRARIPVPPNEELFSPPVNAVVSD